MIMSTHFARRQLKEAVADAAACWSPRWKRGGGLPHLAHRAARDGPVAGNERPLRRRCLSRSSTSTIGRSDQMGTVLARRVSGKGHTAIIGAAARPRPEYRVI